MNVHSVIPRGARRAALRGSLAQRAAGRRAALRGSLAQRAAGRAGRRAASARRAPFALALVFALFGAACASEVAVGPAHPASVSAPTGRLAGAPPSLRAGVVSYPDVPPLRPAGEAGAGHHHHHHP